MALFSRSLKPGGDAGSPATNKDSETESSSARHTIGVLLRETRLSYGGEIDRISALLRIRAPYLTAIEESQYDKLPGPVYAQGFVRAYAVHLGLDGDEAIRRFKQEIAGFEVTRDLSFPVPLAERSIPGGTMVLAALILALCGYGLWYYVSTSDRSHPERVSAVPPDLIAATQKPVVSATASPTVPAPTGAVPREAPSVAPNVTPGPVATTEAAPLAPPPASPAPVSPPTIAAPTATVPTLVPAPTPAAPALQAAPPAAPILAPAQTASAPPAADAATQPRVYGAPADMPARIVVRAIKDSWVQISAGGDVLVQRTLHPGDSVRVPDQSGLSLRTGNGTGIQFEIDGKLFKPLSGTVRTIALDPAYLAANNGSPPRAE